MQDSTSNSKSCIGHPCNIWAHHEQSPSGFQWNIDDILVFGKDFQTIFQSLYIVLICISTQVLYLKFSKCKLFRAQFLFWDTYSAGMVCPLILANCRQFVLGQLQREFFGFSGYDWRFVKNYVTMAAPVVKFVWDDSYSWAFDMLKSCLISAPVLAFPRNDCDFLLITDASNYGIWVVLQETVLMYCSKALRPSQLNYCITKRDLLANVSVLLHFSGYIWLLWHKDNN